MKYEISVGATRVRSEAHSDYANVCDRCGGAMATRWHQKAADGLSLCKDCREGADRYWQQMASGEAEFRWTTDEELAALEECEIKGPSSRVGRTEWTCMTHGTMALLKDPAKHPNGKAGRARDVYCPMRFSDIEQREAS